jgi:hypothetical protein
LLAQSDPPGMVGKQRLAWECIAEFGRRGRIGRSQERTGSAAVGVDAEQLTSDIGMLAARLREEVEGLRALDDAVFVEFFTGWLHHLRHNWIARSLGSRLTLSPPSSRITDLLSGL